MKKGIGIGYVPPDYSAVETEIDVVIRGRETPAKIVELPFYDTSKYGWRRER